MPHASPGSALTEAVAVKSQKRGSTREKVPFPQKLVLHRWLLSLFGVKSISELGKDLRDEALEGYCRATALLHRLEHLVRGHVVTMENGEERDAGASYSVSGRGSRELYTRDAGVYHP